MQVTRYHPLHSKSDCEKFEGATELAVLTCPVCAITYAIPQQLKESAQKYNRTTEPRNHWSWCCPMGHVLSFPGKNREQQLRDDLDRERSRSGRMAAQRDQARASAKAHKGAATRARNQRDRIGKRVKAGVCPCCNRTFKQLRRHMKSQHPDFEPAQPEHPSKEADRG